MAKETCDICNHIFSNKELGDPVFGLLCDCEEMFTLCSVCRDNRIDSEGEITCPNCSLVFKESKDGDWNTN